MKPYFTDKLTNEEYHAGEGLSSSQIKLLVKSSAHFAAHVPEETNATKIGTWLHSAVIEPFLFDYESIIPLDKRLKAGGDAWLKKQSDLQTTIRELSEAILNDPDAEALINKPGFSELSGFFELDGELCKIRTDRITEDYSLFMDIKTTTEDDIQGCVRAILKYGYDISYALYAYGIEQITGVFPDFYWIFVSKKAPNDVFVLKPSEEMYVRGIQLVKKGIKNYKELKKNNFMPIKNRYGIVEVQYPSYINFEEEVIDD